jgi:formylglycine-generating enzyme required for sulfatase activity
MDAYEATVGRFRAFARAYEKPNAGSGRNLNDPADTGWNASWNQILPADSDALIAAILTCGTTLKPSPSSNPLDETLPISCVTWYEAYSFCIWDGGRLATDAEWNFAAVGGSEQRIYPWSNPPTAMVIDHSYATYDGDPIKTVGFASPKGDSKWGASDLLGNVFEWVADYAGDLPHDCRDCANLTTGDRRMSRSSGAGHGADILTPNDDPPDARNDDVGIRCVRSL